MPDFSNFACDNCGACCRKLIVEPTYVDAMREPRLFQLASPNLDLQKFRDGEHTIHLWDTERHCCPLLDAQNRCTIYATRPQQCVVVEPGDAKCQQARELEGLPILLDQDGKRPSFEAIYESAVRYGLDFIPYWPEAEVDEDDLADADEL